MIGFAKLGRKKKSFTSFYAPYSTAT